MKALHAETQGQLQRIAVLDRSGGRCEFEIAVVGLLRGETHHEGERIVERVDDLAWVRCGSARDIETAHVVRKWKCGDIETDDGVALKWHPLVAVSGCQRHHRMFDARLYRGEVRLPADRAEAARRLILHTLAAARARGEAAVDVDLTHLERNSQ